MIRPPKFVGTQICRDSNNAAHWSALFKNVNVTKEKKMPLDERRLKRHDNFTEQYMILN